jgi:hypothetical protein
MPATYLDVRSTPVAQQLAAIHASVKQEGDHIVELLENNVVEAQLVMASLLRMRLHWARMYALPSPQQSGW